MNVGKLPRTKKIATVSADFINDNFYFRLLRSIQCKQSANNPSISGRLQMSIQSFCITSFGTGILCKSGIFSCYLSLSLTLFTGFKCMILHLQVYCANRISHYILFGMLILCLKSMLMLWLWDSPQSLMNFMYDELLALFLKYNNSFLPYT